MSTLRTLGRAYSMSLKGGFVTPEAVVSRLDGIIADSKSPPIEVIEASMAATAVGALIEKLDELPGTLDACEATRIHLGHLAAALERDPDRHLRPIIRRLFEMVVNDEAPDGAASMIYYFDDALDLADDGVTERGADLLGELESFLAEYRGAEKGIA